ncbi:RNA polymerase sigma factor [Methylobacterium sp. ID0610]|uniref:RNA polymerase sigma factor n=1 Tax=Methylobacterium carpenticola TaxID=3344827 RepID=UPI00369E7406
MRPSRIGAAAAPEEDGPDLAEALAALSDADLVRLEAVARLRARSVPGLDPADLLHEAVLRALSGARHRPPGLPLTVFLAGCMRSLCQDHWRRLQRERRVMVAAGETRVEAEPDPAPQADPERVLAAAQALRALRGLFERDATVLAILDGLAQGATPPEIRSRYGLSETTYDTARRRMRRALLRLSSDGARS